MPDLRHINPTEKRREQTRRAQAKYLQTHRKQKNELNKRLYRERKTFIESFKKKCLRCPETHIACLDFHHRDESQKLFTIAGVMTKRKLSVVLAEIEKCDILCANCHRKLHYSERSGNYGSGNS